MFDTLDAYKLDETLRDLDASNYAFLARTLYRWVRDDYVGPRPLLARLHGALINLDCAFLVEPAYAERATELFESLLVEAATASALPTGSQGARALVSVHRMLAKHLPAY